MKPSLVWRVGLAGIAAIGFCGVFFAACWVEESGPRGAGGAYRASHETVGVLGVEAASIPLPPNQRAAQQRAVKWLKQAVAKAGAVEQHRRRGEYALITDAATGHCGAEAVDVVRSILAAIEETPLPPDEHVLYARLAATVAPYDVALRDELLRSAIVEGRRAADTEELWQGSEKPGPFAVPTRAERARWRRLLLFRMELWECVLLLTSEPLGATRRLTSLLGTARKAGYTPGDEIHSYEDWLLDDLATLDPRVVLAVWPDNRGEEVLAWFPELAEFCYHQAYYRHTNGMRDSFTAFLAQSAAERGFVSDRPQSPLAEYERWEGLRPPEPEIVEHVTRLRTERLLRDAAAQPHSIDPDHGTEGVEEWLFGLTDPIEKGRVLSMLAEQLVRSNEPELAESLLERIESPQVFIGTACSLAVTFVEQHRGEVR